MPSLAARAPSTLAELAGASVRLFPIGGVLLLAGVLLMLVFDPTAVIVIGIVLTVAGVVICALALSLFLSAARWNRTRSGSWSSLAVTVVPEEADWEARRTLLDSADGRWRLAMLDYPLELRDALVGGQRIEYVGDLVTDGRILVRVPDLSSERFAGVKSRASLRP